MRDSEEKREEKRGGTINSSTSFQEEKEHPWVNWKLRRKGHWHTFAHRKRRASSKK